MSIEIIYSNLHVGASNVDNLQNHYAIINYNFAQLFDAIANVSGGNVTYIPTPNSEVANTFVTVNQWGNSFAYLTPEQTIVAIGAAPNVSPNLLGVPTAPFPNLNNVSNTIATTSWTNSFVANAIANLGSSTIPSVVQFANGASVTDGASVVQFPFYPNANNTLLFYTTGSYNPISYDSANLSLVKTFNNGSSEQLNVYLAEFQSYYPSSYSFANYIGTVTAIGFELSGVGGYEVLGSTLNLTGNNVTYCAPAASSLLENNLALVVTDHAAVQTVTCPSLEYEQYFFSSGASNAHATSVFLRGDSLPKCTFTVPQFSTVNSAVGLNTIAVTTVIYPQVFTNELPYFNSNNEAWFTASVPGSFAINSIIWQVPIVNTIYFPGGLTNSIAYVRIPAAANYQLTLGYIRNNVTYILGTIVFQAGQNYGSFAVNNSFVLAPTDIIYIASPSYSDSSLQGLSVNILGTKI